MLGALLPLAYVRFRCATLRDRVAVVDSANGRVAMILDDEFEGTTEAVSASTQLDRQLDTVFTMYNSESMTRSSSVAMHVLERLLWDKEAKLAKRLAGELW